MVTWYLYTHAELPRDEFYTYDMYNMKIIWGYREMTVIINYMSWPCLTLRDNGLSKSQLTGLVIIGFEPRPQ